MNRDTWPSDYDDVYASDTSGYAPPWRDAPRRGGMRERDEGTRRDVSAWDQSRLFRQPSRPFQGMNENQGRRGPRAGSSWNDDPFRSRGYPSFRTDDNTFGLDVDEDETSGYAQGYAGYGQGQGDAGPRSMRQGRGPAMSYGRPADATSRPSTHMGQGPHLGKGPKGYRRSDERIRDDICEALMLDPWLDASRLEVSVQDGIVTLEGTVGERYMKYLAEDCAAHASGVQDVENHIRLDRLMAVDRPGADSPNPREKYPDEPING